MAKIGVVATYKDFTKLAEQVAADLKQDICIKIGALEEGVEVARYLQGTQDVEAIIARAPTGHMIAQNIAIPTIVIEITDFDIIRAFHRARLMGDKIVFIDFERQKLTYRLGLIQEILNLEVGYIQFKDISQIQDCVEAAYEKGAEVIVGTASCLVHAAEKHGMHGILVTTSYEDIREAMERACQTIAVKKEEKEKAKWLNTIIDNSYEGIMTTDQQGRISVYNRAAEEMIGLKKERVVNTHISELAQSNPAIQGIYGDGKETRGEVVQLKKQKLLVNRLPIYTQDQFKGLVIHLHRTDQIQEMESKIRKELYTKGLVAKATFEDIVGESAVMQELKNKALQYGKSPFNVLIYGESGTGKELFAQSIHNVSACKDGPFLAINCASLPENLLESELFGYEEGAFTGAKKGGKLGLFELAHGGTIFLDEIGEMPLSLQSRLLRVLQEKEVIRLGGERVIPVNTRIICATNRDLLEKVKNGTFREDLYYRINILRLDIPPLRERKEDIVLIAKEVLSRKTRKVGKAFEVPDALLQELTRYHWPGNVRELEAFIERLLALSVEPVIDEGVFRRLLAETMKGQAGEEGGRQEEPKWKEGTLEIKLGTMAEMEKQIIDLTLKHLKGNKDELVKTLGISRTTLWRRLRN